MLARPTTEVLDLCDSNNFPVSHSLPFNTSLAFCSYNVRIQTGRAHRNIAVYARALFPKPTAVSEVEGKTAQVHVNRLKSIPEALQIDAPRPEQGLWTDVRRSIRGILETREERGKTQYKLKRAKAWICLGWCRGCS